MTDIAPRSASFYIRPAARYVRNNHAAINHRRFLLLLADIIDCAVKLRARGRKLFVIINSPMP